MTLLICNPKTSAEPQKNSSKVINKRNSKNAKMYKRESSFFEKKIHVSQNHIRMSKCGNNKFDPEKSNILPIFLFAKFAGYFN